MTTSAQYAKALYALMEEHPRRSVTYLKHLREALASRGHEKLLPQILREYQKLELHGKRLAGYAKESPEIERTRILLELYRALIHGSARSSKHV